MELEIGMYVRTINGKIWVIISQRAISGHRKDIIKASYNIIDLIEIGDYVNHHRVVDIESNNEDKTLYLYVDTLEYNEVVYQSDIKSILTKEQFESMEYKVC